MIGLLGLLILYGAAYALSENRKAVSWRLVAWGIGLQIIFAFIILRTSWGPGRVSRHRRRGAAATLLCRPGIDLCVRASGRPRRQPRLRIRLPRAADRYFHFVVFQRPLLHGGDAAPRAADGQGDAPADGRIRIGVAGRRGQRLHGADRGPDYRRALHCGDDEVRAHGPHDERHGDGVRRGAGLLHRARRARRVPADRQRHGGTGFVGDGEVAHS